MLAEGELRSNSDESDKVRELQDKVADLKAEVNSFDLCSICELENSLLPH